LLEVDRPGNNTATTLPEVYAYYSGGHLLNYVCSPRYVLSQRAHGGTAQEGDTVNFTYTSGNLTSWYDYGVVNFTPSDGMNIVLQSGVATGLQTWHTESFSYNA